MLIPVPLCAVHVEGYYGATSTTAAFVVVDSTMDISSSFHTQGQRVGSQSGLYGAYIDESTVPSYSYGTGFGICINAPSETPSCHFTTFSTIPLRWAVSCGWRDDTYYYTAIGVATAVASCTKTSEGIRVTVRDPHIADGHIHRCVSKDLDAKIFPGSTWTSYGEEWDEFSVQSVELPETTQEVSSIDEANAVVSSLWTKYEVFNVFRFEAQLAASLASWKGYGRNRQPNYWPVDPLPDYTRTFNQLLYLFPFNDPALATGTIASEAHYDLQVQKNKWGREISKNVWIPRGGPYGTYEFEWLTQHAFMDAADSIPKANDNSIQNIMALVELLVALKNADLSEIPDLIMKKWEDATRNASAAAESISDMWMRYRYEYSTTKMDIEEYVKYGLEKLDRYMMCFEKSRTHGTAKYDDMQCRCALSWKERGLTGLSKFCHALWEQGLEPNSYVLWDFVPFSFVADWFAPIGDVLHVFSDSQYMNTGYYEFSDIVFSIRYRTGPIAGIEAEHYVRWVADKPPLVDHTYWFDTGQSSTGVGTIAKRVMDSGCLLSSTIK